MAQFKSYEPGIEVMGRNALAPINGMGTFKRMAEKFLEEAGLKDIKADDMHWYPLQNYLDAFRLIAEKVGDATLQKIGMMVMSSAVLPPMNSVEEALGLMDIAYHMNYRDAKKQIMFDPKRNPQLIDGIGHYSCELVKGEKKALMVCSSPYPCAYDLGIVCEFSQHYQKAAKVTHDDSFGCRKKGADACRYIVSW